MDCEQVWISNNDESSQLYKIRYIDSSDFLNIIVIVIMKSLKILLI